MFGLARTGWVHFSYMLSSILRGQNGSQCDVYIWNIPSHSNSSNELNLKEFYNKSITLVWTVTQVTIINPKEITCGAPELVGSLGGGGWGACWGLGEGGCCCGWPPRNAWSRDTWGRVDSGAGTGGMVVDHEEILGKSIPSCYPRSKWTTRLRSILQWSGQVWKPLEEPQQGSREKPVTRAHGKFREALWSPHSYSSVDIRWRLVGVPPRLTKTKNIYVWLFIYTRLKIWTLCCFCFHSGKTRFTICPRPAECWLKLNF